MIDFIPVELLQRKMDVELDITSKIGIAWAKLRLANRVLLDPVLLRLKGHFYMS